MTESAYLSYLEGERKAALLYRALADTVTGERRAALLELADIEEQHAAHWVDVCDSHGIPVPPAPEVLDVDDAALVRRARAAGLTSVLADLEATENANAGLYDGEPLAPADMARDERRHATALAAMRPPAGTPSAQTAASTPVDFGESWHRGDRSGAVRAAVFGISDGLVSNTALVMGFAGGAVNGSTVLFAGVAGLLAGAFSMAAGEYVSVASQRDLFQREIDIEAAELRDKPEEERRELELIYRAKGLDRDAAAVMADRIMADPAVALDTLAREELGLDPSQLGSPVKVASSSFAAFAVGAIVPVIPYLLTVLLPAVIPAGLALALAIGLSLMSMVAVGMIVGRLSGRGILRSVIRQVAFGTAAAAVTFVIGRIIGTTLG